MHHLVDGIETDAAGVEAENGVEDEADGPGGDVRDHQGLDVFVDADLTDAGGEVGGSRQRGDVGAAEGTGDDDPGSQSGIDTESGPDPDEGNPHGRDSGEGASASDPDQGADDKDGWQEELYGDDLKTEVHDGGDGSREDPGGDQHPDGEEDDQRINAGP